MIFLSLYLATCNIKEKYNFSEPLVILSKVLHHLENTTDYYIFPYFALWYAVSSVGMLIIFFENWKNALYLVRENTKMEENGSRWYFLRKGTVPKTPRAMKLFNDSDYYYNWLLFTISQGELLVIENLVTHWTLKFYCHIGNKK